MSAPPDHTTDLSPANSGNDAPYAHLPAVIVEDNPVDAAVLTAILERAGFEVTTIEDPRQTWNFVAEHPAPALVILDMRMPDFTGPQVLEHIRQHPGWRKVPVLVVSGLTARQDIMEALRAGANGYIAKPYDARRLIKEIARHVPMGTAAS